ncbi:MAG: hypothetical protein BMS9Abin05_0027 [Rhodothermia bacterium]|nr:MAG: hypothetical protein BMS9Abin05_0027 [Rhodothermia bacterium]
MDRRRFIIKAGQAFPVFAGAVYLVGCDSNSDNTGGNNNGGNNGGNNQPTILTATSTVVAGHSHSAQIPTADFASASNETYDTSNSGGHIHMVTLSAAQLASLGSGGVVTVTSTNNSGHTHRFTFQLIT